MDKRRLLRPKKIVWRHEKWTDTVITFEKIDHNFYREFKNGEIIVHNRKATLVNPYCSNYTEFFETYVKAFDKACFDEELDVILSGDREGD